MIDGFVLDDILTQTFKERYKTALNPKMAIYKKLFMFQL